MYTVAITDNATGETVLCELPGEFDSYLWDEGNYSCDCNREIFFRRAKGEEVDSNEVFCSEGRFSYREEAQDGP